MNDPPVVTARKLCRAGLACYPRGFQRRYGEEVDAVFTELLHDAYDQRGRWGLLITTAAVVADLAVRLVPEHCAGPVKRPSAQGDSFMNVLLQDLHHALRSLRKSPGFTAVVVLTLAITLGANATMFGLVDAVVLRPLPFDEPERLVALWDVNEDRKWRVSGSNFLRWKEQNKIFEHLALYVQHAGPAIGLDEPVMLYGSEVTDGFFPLLGVDPLLGRTLLGDDYAADAEGVIVLSHTLWTHYFGADPDVLGRRVNLEGESHAVVGVLRRQVMPLVANHSGHLDFGASEEHYWIPMKREPYPRSHVHGVLGRLADGVSLTEAEAAMETVALRLEAEYPATNQGFQVGMVPLVEEAVGDVRRPFWLLLAAVGLVLLIACANVANLLLVRGAERGREFAVRSVLGAGRLRIWRQILTEGAVLAFLGAALGALLAYWGLRLVPLWSPSEIPRLDEAGLDLRVWGVTLGLCVFAAVLCSLVPALRAGHRDLESALRSAGRGESADGGPRLRQLLVSVEMTLAVVLVIGSALLLRSFDRLRSVDPGFHKDQVLTFLLLHHPNQFRDMDRLNGFYDELLGEVRAMPGVVSVGAAYDHPLTNNWNQTFALENLPAPPDERRDASFRTVTPGYLETLGIEVLEGRAFTEGDRADTTGVAIVNQAFARRFLPGRRALGERFSTSTTQWEWGKDAIPSSFEIVGLVEDVSFAGLDAAAQPAYYLPYRQTPQRKMTVCVRTEREPRSLMPEIRTRLSALAPGLPVSQVTTVEELFSNEVSKPRFNAGALAAFAAFALLLAMLGLWGVLHHVVRRRRHEIGIRMALGAGRRQVFGWMIWHGLRPAALGLVVGLLGALALSRTISGLLFEVSPLDPVTYAVVGIALTGVALVACAVPARQASRTDPMTVLRDE